MFYTDAVVYTSCDSLQVDGFTGAGYYLIDQDGSEGPNEPSLVKCDGNTGNNNYSSDLYSRCKGVS